MFSSTTDPRALNPRLPNASVMDYLEADHRRLDSLMEECRAFVASGHVEEAGARYEEFRSGLLRHIRIEEDLLFPAFDQATGFGEGGPTTVMRYEHAEIQRLLESLREVFASDEPSAAEFEKIRSQLAALLEEHGSKEERILYPMTDRLVPPAERLELIRKMQAL